MKQALVLGSSRGIGASICQKLLTLGYQVHGIARSQPSWEGGPNYQHHPLDLLKEAELRPLLSHLKKELKKLELLIPSAGVGYFPLHEELNDRQILSMSRLNLEIPMRFSQHFLRTLKANQGWILFLGSTSAHQANLRGASYSATKAGIEQFAQSLFEEQRRYHLKVCTICADIVASDFYQDRWLNYHPDPKAHLTPETIADLVATVLQQPEGVVIPKILVKPQLKKVTTSKKGSSNTP